MIYQYRHLVIGGTFDRLHLGHQNFILRAFQLAEKVTIGITSNAFIKNKSENQQTATLENRKKAIINFLTDHKIANRYSFSTLHDIFGITKTKRNIDAILVTKETLPNAVVINKFRKKNKLPKIKIEMMSLIKSKDNKIIRSQRIRFGEIDRNGKIYGRMFRKKLSLPINLRELLRKPVGKIINQINQKTEYGNRKSEDRRRKSEIRRQNTEIEKRNYLFSGFSHQSSVFSCPFSDLSHNKSPMIISVGDIVSQELEKQKIIPAVKIIDLRSRRQPIRIDAKYCVSSIKKIINPPGFIYPRAVQTIHKAIIKYYKTKKPQTVIIKGEEDLLTLPAILLASLSSFVIYGQKDVGAVMVKVTEEIKQKIFNIIKQFTMLK